MQRKGNQWMWPDGNPVSYRAFLLSRSKREDIGIVF
ncbi:unnamed protein product [Haemonchus placei]|uniref:Uncharacterized protein n=1 Tax=Haemonchus placei TaxID=6290 RepID=A0A3P7XEJ9_HAEPC|nr:unnamed protein product [Haemonchus placei]